MKTIYILLLGTLLAWIGVTVCPIWALVEFILYLVKDHQFNWWSIWLFIISIVILVIAAFYSAVEESNKNHVVRNYLPKSKFQQRLDEVMEKRNKN